MPPLQNGYNFFRPWKGLLILITGTWYCVALLYCQAICTRICKESIADGFSYTQHCSVDFLPTSSYYDQKFCMETTSRSLFHAEVTFHRWLLDTNPTEIRTGQRSIWLPSSCQALKCQVPYHNPRTWPDVTSDPRLPDHRQLYSHLIAPDMHTAKFSWGWEVGGGGGGVGGTLKGTGCEDVSRDLILGRRCTQH